MSRLQAGPVAGEGCSEKQKSREAVEVRQTGSCLGDDVTLMVRLQEVSVTFWGGGERDGPENRHLEESV